MLPEETHSRPVKKLMRSFTPSALLRTALLQAAEFAFPTQCVLCRSANQTPGEFDGSFCPQCSDELCPAPINRCQCCGAEIGLYAVSDKGCTHCRNRTLRFESVTCLGMYEGLLRKAVLSAKWSFSAVRMQSLAKLLARERAEELSSLNVDRVVPIPQHWRQRLLRSFNPSWIIAERVAATLKVPFDSQLLQRCRMTRSQKRVAVSQKVCEPGGLVSIAESGLRQEVKRSWSLMTSSPPAPLALKQRRFYEPLARNAATSRYLGESLIIRRSKSLPPPAFRTEQLLLFRRQDPDFIKVDRLFGAVAFVANEFQDRQENPDDTRLNFLVLKERTERHSAFDRNTVANAFLKDGHRSLVHSNPRFRVAGWESAQYATTR